jgi:S1-C subfamily serine protease
MRRFLALLALSLALYSLTGLLQAQDAAIDLERIQRATVFIIQARSDNLTMTCIGSGTIVRYDGLILTNAHHTVQSETCPGDTLIIAMTINLNEPPVPKYRASIVQADTGLDLALIRVTQEFDGRPIDPLTLPVLPFVEVVDSTLVTLDETMTLVGYPAAGNDPVLVTQGTLTGFIDEPGAAGRAWMKLNTLEPAPGTMSGGGAYNGAGQLVGIPTAAPSNSQTPGADCQLLEDTNSDGFINNNDTCVPVGDFINVLRPSNYARALIRGAALGLTIETLTAPAFQNIPAGLPTFTRSFIAPSVVDGLPSTVIGSAPAGTTSLYLFFDYQNMTPNTIYEMRVTVDGVPNRNLDLPPVRWSGGENGLWYIGMTGQPYANGTYEFRLFINGTVATTQPLVIGGPAEAKPVFGNMVFGILDAEGNLQGNGYVLPTGLIATARFVYQNMQPGIPWTAIWYYNTLEIQRVEETWREEFGANGTYPLNLQPSDGQTLPPGKYRVDIYLNRLLSITGDFIVAGAQGGMAIPGIFSGVEFVRASSPQEVSDAPLASTYPDGAEALYLRFDWQQMAQGIPWTMRWRVDNDIFYERTVPWTSPESGQDFITRVAAPGGLPDGTYDVELLINNILLVTTEATVGIGQLTIDELAQPGGAQMRGQIVDADTGVGIPGVTFILISDQFSVSDFTWLQTQIYAQATTDRNGFFEIDRPLRLDAPYSAIIAAGGYLPVTADGLEVTADTPIPIDLYIPLTRD